MLLSSLNWRRLVSYQEPVNLKTLCTVTVQIFQIFLFSHRIFFHSSKLLAYSTEQIKFFLRVEEFLHIPLLRKVVPVATESRPVIIKYKKSFYDCYLFL